MLKYFIVHFVEEGTEAQTHEVTHPGHRAESKEFEQSGGFSLFSSPPEIILQYAYSIGWAGIQYNRVQPDWLYDQLMPFSDFVGAWVIAVVDDNHS